MQALNAANGAPVASPSAASSRGAPGTTPNLPTYVPGFSPVYLVYPATSSSGYGTAAPATKTVAPAGVANAVGGANIPPSSGSILSAALPAGSLVAAAVFILALGHY